MVAFYEATGGANWEDNTNWLSEEPIYEWYGVTTDEEGRVFRLDLSDNGLTGVAAGGVRPTAKPDNAEP